MTSSQLVTNPLLTNPLLTNLVKQEFISVRGAREHNLCAVDCDLPRGSLVVVTGPSGSGKSSLVFDTIYGEWRRRLYALQHPSVLGHEMIRPVRVDSITGLSYSIGIPHRVRPRSGNVTLAKLIGISESLILLYTHWGVQLCGQCGAELVIRSRRENLDQLSKLSQGQEIELLASLGQYASDHLPTLSNELESKGYVRWKIDGKEQRISDLSLGQLPVVVTVAVVIDRFVHGVGSTARLIEGIQLASELSGGDYCAQIGARTHRFSERNLCAECGAEAQRITARDIRTVKYLGKSSGVSGESGSRHPLNHLQLAEGRLRYQGRTLLEVLESPAGGIVNELASWLRRCESDGATGALRAAIEDLDARFRMLTDLGAGYLSLNRSVRTLSGGEYQKACLVSSLASRVRGVTLLIDEPSIGLHPADAEQLIKLLLLLRDQGNSLVVIDHDQSLIRAADYLLVMGPGGGKFGGRVVAAGVETEKLVGVLGGPKQPQKTSSLLSPASEHFVLTGVSTYNLKGINVAFVVGGLNVVVGVSGSGKSSLVTSTVVPVIADRLATKNERGRWGFKQSLSYRVESVGGIEKFSSLVDATQLSRLDSRRSTVATTLGLHQELRLLFAKTTDAKYRGLLAEDFSFNRPSGWCERCRGLGVVDTAVGGGGQAIQQMCERCLGTRYRPEILEVRYRGRSIAEALQLTVDEAGLEFVRLKRLTRKLREVSRLGLGYLSLSQTTTDLSLGEAQRLHLVASMLKGVKRRDKQLKDHERGTLYCLDEPTTGLGLDEVRQLLGLLCELTNAGATVVLVEHHPEVIRTADKVIELGPGAGDMGGEVIAEGSPAEIKLNSGSRIGRYL